MNAELILTQPAWLLALCVLGGAAVAALLYWGAREVAQPWRTALALLRGTVVTAIAFLLLGPLLRSVDKRTQRPVLVIAEDRSASVREELSGIDADLDALAERLGETYDVQRLGFGERVRPLAGDTLQDEVSNLADVFAYVADAYAPELLGGVVLATDGIYNQGADPTYAAARVASPVYTVALGDSTVSRDVAVRDVLYNRIGYLGDRLEVQVDVQATNASGGASTVTLSSVGPGGRARTLATKRVQFGSADDFQTVRLEVELARAGVQQFRVAATPVGEERNRVNNVRQLYVDVLDARQRIALVAAAPHPDVSALRQALESNENYEVTFVLAADLKDELREADLAVFHNLPAAGAPVDTWLRGLDERGTGRLFVAGPRTDLAALATAQGLLPITPKAGSGNAVMPRVNGGFRLFTIPEEWVGTINSYPPALAPFAELGAPTTGDVLLSQRIGRVDTDFPLLALGEASGHKVGVLMAQDLWRWRLYEYQQTSAHEAFDGLLLATAQYLALREDKRPFRVTSSEKVYTTSDEVRLQAELYNASFQLVNESEVSVRITDGAGTAYPFTMDKVGRGYQLRAGRLPAGRYSYRAATTFDGEEYVATGGFTVRDVELEALNTTADWALLRRMSDQQGGATVTGDAVATLAERILASERAKPVLYQSVRTRPLIDWPWLLAIALGLLAVEWFVRRRLGTY